jgi:hypothetical protein
MLAESLPTAPAVLTLDLHSCKNAFLETHTFGIMLEPRYIVGTERLDQ